MEALGNGSCSSEGPSLYSKRCFGALASSRFELPLKTRPGRCTIRGPSPGILGLPLTPPRKSTPSPWNELFPLSPPGRCTMKWEGCTLLKKGVFLPIAHPQKQLWFSPTRKGCSAQSKTLPARQVWVL